MPTPDTETTTNLPSEPTAKFYVLVRPRPGVVGERKRVVHFVLKWRDEADDQVTMCCGEHYPAEDLEVLGAITGMPCTPCLIHS